MEWADAVDKGRELFEQQAWAEVYDCLSAADRETPLDPDDLERLATSAYLLGRDTDSVTLYSRAHQDFLDRGEIPRAARCAFWLGLTLLNRGERARGAGWTSRAQRLVDELDHDCVEQGFLLVPRALRNLSEGNVEAAETTFRHAGALGERFSNPDLITLGRLGRGQALIRMEEIDEGVALLDEAMANVEAGSVSPIVAGIVYCAVLEACREIFDLRRAQEWTDAMSEWCAAQPDLVPFRGQCMVQRAEIMQLHGEWPAALNEARQASTRLSEPAAGRAFYRQAELLRLQGEFDTAEDAYRKASQGGRRPQPGLALLRLAQGRLDAARTAIREELDCTMDRSTRARVLPAYVEIMLAAEDVEAARTGAEELSEIAGDVDSRLLEGLAAHAQGAVLLAEGTPREALDTLRSAWTSWNELEAPYEGARVRVLMGRAYRALGDADTAAMELDAARRTFDRLGAVPDFEETDALIGHSPDRDSHGLTPRQLEVLHGIAAGKTNKAIGEELFISERTVERHVSNIFDQLDVSTRSEATAYAYKHHLV